MAKRKLKPEVEHVSHFSNESIRYLQHGYPSKLVRWHCHAEYELHYIAASRGKAFIGDYIGNFNDHSLYLVGPNLPHNWISEIEPDENIEVRDLVVNFSHELIESCNANFPEMQQLNDLWENAKYGIEFLDPDCIEQAHHYLVQISKQTGFKRLTLFWCLIDLLGSSKNIKVLSNTAEQTVTGKKVLKQMSQAIAYITDNFDSEITQEEVAELVNMSNTYFCKVFKKTTGHRFVNFVNGCRIDKACDLLKNTEEPVTEICFRVGFNNISNFNRQFFNVKGMTPSNYRKTSLASSHEALT